MGPGVRRGKRKRVAVLVGGPSSEHEVSLRSGANVIRSIDSARFEPRRVFISRTGVWEVSPDELRSLADVAFIAMHGAYGEDGTVQSLLDSVGLPYTGSGAMASALAMNKYLSLRLFRDSGLAVPLTRLVTKRDWQQQLPSILNWLRLYAGYPAIVKPNAGGSSVGATIVEGPDEVAHAFESVFDLSREALIQNFVLGHEVTCGVLDRGTPKSAFALLPTAIVPRVSPFFDYRAKYEPNGTAEITPAPFPPSFLREIQRAALACHYLVGARGFSRTDMVLDTNGAVQVLELNTIPGLTEESLLPKAAAAHGIAFPALLSHILESALA